MEWIQERVLCSEWLNSYREILNTWQMWQSRAMFDVGRVELLRKLRDKHTEEVVTSGIPLGGRGEILQLLGRRGGSFPNKRQPFHNTAIQHKYPGNELLIPVLPAHISTPFFP